MFNRVAPVRSLTARFMAVARDSRVRRADKHRRWSTFESKFMKPPPAPDIGSKFVGKRPRRLRALFRARHFGRLLRW